MSSVQDGWSEGHPAFPTPSLGGRFTNASGASRRKGEVVIASAAKQSILFARQDGLLRFARNDGRGNDCFAALVIGRALARPLARNDD
jgi:hypothetical protein